MKRILACATVLAAGCARAGLADDVAAAEQRLATLRSQVAPLAAPLLVPDVDMRVYLSLTPVAAALADLNRRPPEARTVVVQSIGRNGNIWSDGDWCNSYLELESGDSLRMTAELSQMNASFLPDGSIELGALAAVRGKVQVKFQFKGKRVHLPFGGSICPPGGGVGTSIGVGLSKDQDFAVQLAFAPSADKQSVSYSARLARPGEVKVTAQIGLGRVGTIGYPMAFGLPQAPIASGTVPLLLGREGTFQLPGGSSRSWSLRLVPASFSTAGKAVTASWKGSVAFDTPAP